MMKPLLKKSTIPSNPERYDTGEVDWIRRASRAVRRAVESGRVDSGETQFETVYAEALKLVESGELREATVKLLKWLEQATPEKGTSVPEGTKPEVTAFGP